MGKTLDRSNTQEACPICLNTNLKLQSHHVIPKEYGGHATRNSFLDVCAACHLNIHYTAEAEYVGKKPNYLLPEQRMRATIYVDAIKRAKSVHESADQRNLMKKVTLELPEQDLIRLHKLKADRGFRSIDALLKHLILRELKQI